ncbi:MAG: potassium efflux system protein [Rhodothermales bacterium]|jgi:potassium efflux system protein
MIYSILKSAFIYRPNFWAIAAFACLICSGQVLSQDLALPVEPSQAVEAIWQPPDVTALPVDWWVEFEVVLPSIFRERIGRFLASTEEKISGLDADNLVVSSTILANLRAQVDLLQVARNGGDNPEFEPIPTKGVYTLEDLLEVRAMWRNLQTQKLIPAQTAGQLERQIGLLQNRRDNLLRLYNTTEISAPQRLVFGLQRVSAQVEHELFSQQLTNVKQTLSDIDQRTEQTSAQLIFAREHLQKSDTTLAAVKSEAQRARLVAAEFSQKIAVIQSQLLDVLSATTSKPSLEITRKQQLTRAAVEQALASIHEAMHKTRESWYLLRSGVHDLPDDSRKSIEVSRDLISDTRNQLEVWEAASQTTLITPVPSSDLNAIKNIELAHVTARESLDLITDLNSAIDDLELIQEVFLVEVANTRTGLRGGWLRFSIFIGDIWTATSSAFDVILFRVGDGPVTLAGLFKMLVILALAYALSWFIRQGLQRVKSGVRVANSASMYTLGRLLHYLIVTIALFAALTSIGLDFTKFALIAGALSVGIGFGLQSIVNNFVSGLIILFEGSLRVGDYIELDKGLAGVVREINTRATVINTTDNIDVVVPNSDFVTTRLTNWTLREPVGRLRLPFGVAYGSDKDLVKQAALEAVAETEFILMNMPSREPQVRLVNFGDSSLDFELLAWVSRSGIRRPHRVRSSFLWALETKLTEHGIEIPFPQRDLHLRSGFQSIVEPISTLKPRGKK